MNCSFTGAYMRNYYDARIDWGARGWGAYINRYIFEGYARGLFPMPPDYKKSHTFTKRRWGAARFACYHNRRRGLGSWRLY